MKKITLLICLLTISFANAQLNTLAIVGGGTTAGWPTGAVGEVDALQMTTVDFVHWSINNVILNGAVKFRGNNSWAAPYDWGAGTTFPTGTAVVANGAAITATPGTYNVTFNSVSAAYVFTQVTSTFPVISLIGTATAGGWDADTDMLTTDGINYTATAVPLTAAAVKFRQDHNWTPTTNWGRQYFPVGNWNC